MPLVADSPSLHSRVLETKPGNWRQFQFIQQDDFKSLDDDVKQKLKNSIVENNFTQPFYVWKDPDSEIEYCLDGKHRILLLIELSNEMDVPDMLPTTYLQCANKQEAAKLVLVYSSIYARITNNGLFDFIKLYDIEYDSIKNVIDIPDFSISRFEQKFDFFNVANAEEPEAEVSNVLVQPGDLFELNGHRIICDSFFQEGVMDSLMEGKQARILNCDPPYNLPANFFTNKEQKRHEDFAMGHGEMSDDEFVDFIQIIMQTATDHTVPGAIHYIFMDFRHIWHMTEAARRVYGSSQPKQVCVWNKDIMANGSFYRAKHELCFVFNNPEAKSLWNKDLLDHGGFYKDNNELVFIFKAGDDDVKHLSHLDLKDRIRTNIWNYPSAASIANPDRFELKNHPTPKPVQMIADAILDTTNEGDIVIDFFLGSGTALIAAEQTRRFCYGCDIEPKFVQSQILRYIKFCSKNGYKVNFTHLNGKLTLNDFEHESDKIKDAGKN
jgi:DNA modification methylase